MFGLANDVWFPDFEAVLLLALLEDWPSCPMQMWNVILEPGPTQTEFSVLTSEELLKMMAFL
jgi:hypothetical protein